MDYSSLQQRIYDNKIKRNFNVSDVGKEILLMTEELGELCDALLQNNPPEIIDAIGDLMVYGLGLCAMFRYSADEIINLKLKLPDSIYSAALALYLGREVGMLAKTYKKSNKQIVEQLDRREEFQLHLGKLMGYCSTMFRYLQVDESAVLENIVQRNETRTHQGKI